MAEKAILKYCNWEINIDTPSEFIDNFYNSLLIKYKNNNNIIEKLNEYKDISITLLQYAICEYNIFCEYNQYIISLSSCFISINQDLDEDSKQDVENINIQIELKENFDKIINNLNFNKDLIESCKSLILNNLKNNKENEEKEEENIIKEKEDNLDINQQLEMTRCDSCDSNSFFFEAINNYNFDKEFEDISSNNNTNNDSGNNKSVNFGKVSPIYNGEIISLNEEEEEINNNLYYLNNKKFGNNNKYINSDTNEKEQIFLKNKRKENKI